MLANPHLPTYQYDPYTHKLTLEEYGAEQVLADRSLAIEKARKSQNFGIVVGTLGRQGSLNVVRYIQSKIEQAGKNCYTVLVSEISPDHLQQFQGIDVYVFVFFFTFFLTTCLFTTFELMMTFVFIVGCKHPVRDCPSTGVQLLSINQC